MYFDRPALKRGARQAMRATRPRAMLVTLIYWLLTAGLTTLVSFFIADPFILFSELTEQGLSPNRALFVILSDIGPVGLFLHILLAVFASVISFGYRQWALNVSRSEAAGIGDLVSGFSMVGKILWLEILSGAYCLFWVVSLFMAGALLMLALSILVPILFPVIIVSGSFVVCFIALAFFFTRYLRCTMAPFILMDDPELSALQALRQSLRLMNGKTRHLFFLYLSFIGWFLLCVPVALLAGVLALISPILSVAVTVLSSVALELWLQAYTTITVCKFYDQLRSAQTCEPPFDL